MWKETEFRRDRFQPGLTVQLTDGQSWVLPDPSCSEIAGDEYSMLRAGLQEAEDETEFLQAGLALMIYLLDFNYQLTPTDFRAILESSAAGDRLDAAMRTIAASHFPARDPLCCLDSGPRRSWADFFCLGSLFTLKWGSTRGT